MKTTPRKVERPILWIVAGPNGSGKSTLYNQTDIEDWGGSVWIINPDLLTVRLIEAESLQSDNANREALDRILKWLDASINVHQTIGVETVLATAKYRPLIVRAKEKGFEIRMLYVVLDSVARQLDRIALRVSEGGHDVAADKVRSRRLRSFEQLGLFAEHVDRLMIFNNSSGSPQLVGYKRYKNPLVVFNGMPEDLLLALSDARVPMSEHSDSP